MENKLKTLKDMYSENSTWNMGEMISLKELKAEAVKWIKEIKYAGCGDVSNLEEAKAKSNPNVVDGIKGFIKHFFNITEEELK